MFVSFKKLYGVEVFLFLAMLRASSSLELSAAEFPRIISMVICGHVDVINIQGHF